MEKLASSARLTASALALSLVAASCIADSNDPSTAVRDRMPGLPIALGPPQLPGVATNPLRDVYFGDLHIHTRHSFDAYIFGVRATPDDAYRYARGHAITHALGFPMNLKGPPLDFVAVTDHAAYLGVLRAIDTPGSEYAGLDYAEDLFSDDPQLIRDAFLQFGLSIAEGKRLKEFEDSPAVRTAWADSVAAANRHYRPGEFTTFVAYEFTSAPDGLNLHRNVIFRGGDAPGKPFSALDSQDPEDLWAWLDQQRAAGRDALAIPHNSNGSNGIMFDRVTLAGEPIDADYALARMRNEPLVEVTQVKGTSETHPLLSPNDEFAGFELFEYAIGSTDRITRFEGGYVRQALMTGLQMQSEEGFNPFKFGLVGATDSHNGAGSYYEDNYHSKIGVVDGDARGRGSVPPAGESWDSYTPSAGVVRRGHWSASGLTGVWAEANTRDGIFDALRRKEAFATTGPRIRVRFFAGHDLDGIDLVSDDGVRRAYERGVPMGGELRAREDAAPQVVVAALQDPLSEPLQRVQLIKAWVDSNGDTRERIYDIACSDGLKPDGDTHRCPDNSSWVDLTTCKTSQGPGNVELRATWRDPDFDPGQHALYYVRVLENPKCRWSTWDAIRAGVDPYPQYPATIQDRAYTSPIWIRPR